MVELNTGLVIIMTVFSIWGAQDLLYKALKFTFKPIVLSDEDDVSKQEGVTDGN